VDGQGLTASWIVLATGAKPMPLPIDGAEHVIDSTAFLEIEDLPQRIVFIGGGFISFEFAHFAARLGPTKSQITILEAGPRPLGPFDSEMVDLLVKASDEEGIDIHCDVDIASIQSVDTVFQISLKNGTRLETDMVIHGAGRAPDISDLDLDQAGINCGKNGILVNAHMQTTNPRVFAIGDCAATIQLARVADYEAWIAAKNIRHLETNESPLPVADYTAVPSLLFTYPQYGMVGATEDELAEKDEPYQKSFARNLNWPTYQRVGMKNAAYKLLMGDNGLLLGAHILSDNAAGLLNTLSVAMANTIPMADLYRQSVLAPYPSRESDLHYMLKPFAS
jgi:glutathione reductase (NADPH)